MGTMVPIRWVAAVAIWLIPSAIPLSVSLPLTVSDYCRSPPLGERRSRPTCCYGRGGNRPVGLIPLFLT